jgi:hypothetical protein
MIKEDKIYSNKRNVAGGRTSHVASTVYTKPRDRVHQSERGPPTPMTPVLPYTILLILEISLPSSTECTDTVLLDARLYSVYSGFEQWVDFILRHFLTHFSNHILRNWYRVSTYIARFYYYTYYYLISNNFIIIYK